MTNHDGDVLVSTQLEKGYIVKQSYTLSDEIDNGLLWDKIGKLMDEYHKYKDEESVQIYMFSKMFKEYLIPRHVISCTIC